MNQKLTFVLRILLLLSLVTVVVLNLRTYINIPHADVSSSRVIWNGQEYSPTYGEYTEGKTIAKGNDADWKINAVREDPSHTFIVARSFLDQYLMVSDDYTIPTEGGITTIAWNGNYITDKTFIDAVKSIEIEKTTTLTYETTGIYCLTDTQHMRALYFAYEDCPVATEFHGYMGKVHGEWVITTSISQDTKNEDGSPKTYSVSCYAIPVKYWDILSKYFSESESQ